MIGNGKYKFVNGSYHLIKSIHTQAKAKAASEGVPLNHIIQVLIKQWLDGDTHINYDGLRASKMGRAK